MFLKYFYTNNILKMFLKVKLFSFSGGAASIILITFFIYNAFPAYVSNTN